MGSVQDRVPFSILDILVTITKHASSHHNYGMQVEKVLHICIANRSLCCYLTYVCTLCAVEGIIGKCNAPGLAFVWTNYA